MAKAGEKSARSGPQATRLARSATDKLRTLHLTNDLQEKEGFFGSARPEHRTDLAPSGFSNVNDSEPRPEIKRRAFNHSELTCTDMLIQI